MASAPIAPTPPRSHDVWRCRLCDFKLDDLGDMLAHKRGCFIERKRVVKFEALKRLLELNEGTHFTLEY